VCTADVCETIGSSLLLPAGGYLTLATNGNSAENGGLPGAVWALTAGQFLPNGGGSVQLVDPASNVAALLIYASGGAWPVPNGASLSLDPGHFDAAQAQLGANWCLSTTPYGLGDKGTPGAANLPCP
jgi:hypothetical protein